MTAESPPFNLIRVLIADGNATFLDAAARCLALDGNLAVIGQSATGAEALRQAADLQPDLLLVDIALPDVNGLEVARKIKAGPHPPRVVVLAFNEGAAYADAARNAGADGFVAKIVFYEQMYQLIHTWYAVAAEPGE
jgi:DNA-binding NarL/FixJ family response regulator